MATATVETCLYHSFPRRARDESDAHWAQRALKILDGIARNGLLLTIEDVSWREQHGENLAASVGAVQRRICFTNLRSDEVPNHAEFFGPISIEYSPDAFVHLGGVPVIYFPRIKAAQSGLEGIGAAMVARLADIHGLLESLARLEKRVAQGGDFSMDGTAPDGSQVGRQQFTATETAAIFRFLQCIHQYASIPAFDDLRGALAAIGELFYPTDDDEYTSRLGYYRQREWRILSVRKDGRQVATRATKAQAEELIVLNERFFRRKFRFMDGEDEMAGRCHFFRELNGRHVLSYARRVIVPSAMTEEAREILARHGLGIEVTSSS